MARSISFVLADGVNTEITITEKEDGALLFDLEVLGTGEIGDLRALFFDLEGFDASAGGLVAIPVPDHSGDITDQRYGEASIDTLGKDANIKGAVPKQLGKFDVGIEFGTSGKSRDDIQETSFILSWDFGDLSLDMLNTTDFGIRYTSVGEINGSRGDSAKIGGQSNYVAQDDMLDVEENGQTVGNLLANDANGAANVVMGATWGDGTAFSGTGSGLAGNIVVGGKDYGTVSVLADGTVTVDANGADVDDLAEGETVEVSFTYETQAPDGSTATADATITINGANDAILAEAYNTLSIGTSAGARMISVRSDGSLAQFNFLPNNGGFAYGTALGDINGDDELDVLIAGDWSGGVIYHGDGTGGFTNAGENFTGWFQSRVAIGDIDNDGDGDLYFQNGRGESQVWRNDPGGYTKVLAYDNIGSGGPTFRTAGQAEFGDVNGDGYSDLLITNKDGFTHPISDVIFLNDGTGNFSASSSVLPTGTGFANATLADVNNDGALDYVRGTATGIAVALNDGSGNFASAVSDYGALYNGYVALADFNADGNLDAVRSDPDAGGGIELWLGDGTDSFVFNHTISGDNTGIGGNLHVGDFSGDGIADLLYAAGGAVKTLENDGSGNFAETDTLALSGFIFDGDIGLL